MGFFVGGMQGVFYEYYGDYIHKYLNIGYVSLSAGGLVEPFKTTITPVRQAALSSHDV